MSTRLAWCCAAVASRPAVAAASAGHALAAAALMLSRSALATLGRVAPSAQANMLFGDRAQAQDTGALLSVVPT